jgi:hypothetical protein
MAKQYKYVLRLERVVGYLEYDLCVGCMLDVQKCLETPPTEDQT